MILLLDNYDSFVHNLARYVRRLGCDTKVVRSDEIDPAGCEALSPSAVILSPGPRGPFQAGCSVELVRTLSPHIPILGVCLGHQAIAAAFGGDIVQCGLRHGLPSQVTHDGDGLFRDLPSPLTVGRYHSLAVDESTLPAELQVCARSEDDGVVMGMRHRQRPVFGVQFHPESVLTDHGLTMLRNFVAMCREPGASIPIRVGSTRFDSSHSGCARTAVRESDPSSSSQCRNRTPGESVLHDPSHRDPARGEYAS